MMKQSRREFLATAGGALVAASPFAPASPLLEKIELFRGGEGGYALYRIPGLVTTRPGSVLVWCEARKRTGSDWGQIDIQMRHSTDGGQTFDTARTIANVDGPKTKNPVALAQNLAATEEVTYNNPVMISDRNGTVHLRDRKNVSVRLSYDEGKTWPLVRSLEPGPSGYSDIAVTRNGMILCLYESRSKEKPQSYTAQLTLARFNLAWLIDGKEGRKEGSIV